MSCLQLSEGSFQVLTPLACEPGNLELSKCDLGMAGQLLIFTSTGHNAPLI